MSSPKASHAAATALTLLILSTGSLIVVREWKSAIKMKDSLSSFLVKVMAGFIAPNIFPKCGFPELCIPVSTLAIIVFLTQI